MDLFSIIVPLFNRVKVLDLTISSVVNQTYRNWQLIIIDDGSNDGSFGRAKAWADGNSKIEVYLRQGDVNGAPACRNYGIEKAKGDYLIFLDSDDLLAPDALEKRARVLENKNGLDMLISPCIIFKEEIYDTNILWNINDSNYSDLDRFLILDVPWQTTSVTWKASSLKKIGKWDENLLSFQDWELSIRAVLNSLQYLKIDQPDCFWREPAEGRPSIGNDSISDKHLESHSYLFRKVAKEIKDKNSLTFQRKSFLIFWFFWVFDKERVLNRFGSYNNLLQSFKILDIKPFMYWQLKSIAFFSLFGKTQFIKQTMVKLFHSGKFLNKTENVSWRKIPFQKIREKANNLCNEQH